MVNLQLTMNIVLNFPCECECDDASKNDIIKWIIPTKQGSKPASRKWKHKRVLLRSHLQNEQDQSSVDPELDIFHN